MLDNLTSCNLQGAQVGKVHKMEQSIDRHQPMSIEQNGNGVTMNIMEQLRNKFVGQTLNEVDSPNSRKRTCGSKQTTHLYI